jgi:hypothetical protein
MKSEVTDCEVPSARLHRSEKLVGDCDPPLIFKPLK